MSRILTVLAGAAALAAVGAASARAEAESANRWIEVTGEASVSAPPNFARVTLGVTTAGKDAGKAMAANATATDRLITTIKAAGVDPLDIQTSSLSVSPNFAGRSSDSSEPPAIVGYTVGNEVTVTARDLGRLGALLDSAVGAGANAVSGVTFGLNDPRALLDGVRKDAVRDAKAKAEIYAAGAGAKVGRLMRLSEQGAGVQPFPRPMFAAAKAAPPPPIEAGQEKLTITVTARYELTD